MSLPNFDTLSQYIDAAQNWPGYVWAAAVAFLVCFLWTKAPARFFPNGALWLAAMAAAMTVNLYLAGPAPASAPKGPYRLKLLIIGCVIGLAIRAGYHAIVVWAGARWPVLKSIFDSNTDIQTPGAKPPTKESTNETPV